MNKILKEIRAERKRQDVKWGANRKLSNMEWLTILVEEVGESAEAILKGGNNTRNELIQIIAVGFAWLECIDNRGKR